MAAATDGTAATRYLKISVRDPLKSQDAFGAFITYTIESNSNIPGYVYGEVIVVRRYSDFAWLATELSRTVPGAIIPALPDKQAVGRFQQEFVETRRRALERFLLRVASHPELNVVPQFVAFLQANDAALKNLKNASMEKKVSSMGTTAMSWFEGKVNKMATGSKVALERTTDDFKVDEMVAFIGQLERCIARVAKNAETIVRVERDSAKILAEFGQGLGGLGQVEASTGSGKGLGDAMAQLAATVDGLAATAALHAEAQGSDLHEPFEEYTRLVASARLALQQRADKKTAYIDALTDVEVKTMGHHKVATVAGKEDAANKQHALLLRAEAVAKDAKEEYEAVTRRVLAEFDVFSQQKIVDMRDVLLNYVQLQAEHHKRAEQTWLAVLPALDGLSALPAGALVRLDAPAVASSSSSSSAAGLEVGSTSRLAQSLSEVTVLPAQGVAKVPKSLPNDLGSPSIGSLKNPPAMVIGSPKLPEPAPPAVAGAGAGAGPPATPVGALGDDPLGSSASKDVFL